MLVLNGLRGALLPSSSQVSTSKVLEAEVSDSDDSEESNDDKRESNAGAKGRFANKEPEVKVAVAKSTESMREFRALSAEELAQAARTYKEMIEQVAAHEQPKIESLRREVHECAGKYSTLSPIPTISDLS